MKIYQICGYANPDDTDYCVCCGYKFSTPSSQQTEPSSKQPNPQPSLENNPLIQSTRSSATLYYPGDRGLNKVKNAALFHIVPPILVLIGIAVTIPSIHAATNMIFATFTVLALFYTRIGRICTRIHSKSVQPLLNIVVNVENPRLLAFYTNELLKICAHNFYLIRNLFELIMHRYVFNGVHQSLRSGNPEPNPAIKASHDSIGH